MRNTRYRIAAGVVVLAVLATGAAVVFSRSSQANADAGGMPRFQHVFYIMMENQAYDEIIGKPGSAAAVNAPHINALAQQYALATNYYGVTHDSEPNYVAAVGGSYFAVTNTSSPLVTDNSSDNAYYCPQDNGQSGLPTECKGTTGNHQVNAPSLFSQLEDAGLSWKTYQQSIPPSINPGTPSVAYTGLYYPLGYPGTTSKDKLYASKHNPILNFLAYYGPSNPPTSPDTLDGGSWTPNATQRAELNKMVPDTQLATDLATGNVPNFSFIVPDQCHDMHGTGSCPSASALNQEGDAYVAQTVNAIMSSAIWQRGNNAIVITWDENDYTALDCNTSVQVASNGCQVPTIVVANHGPRGVQYAVAANHYSLLLSIEDAFGLGCLQQACPSSGSHVQPMTVMFRK
jgi:phospholipase C